MLRDERIRDGMFSYVSWSSGYLRMIRCERFASWRTQFLGTLSPDFDALYAVSGRPSIASEYILQALLLQVFYSVCSEELLVEQVDYNLLFHWFVGLGMDDAVWNHAVLSKNWDRLLTSDLAQRFWISWNKCWKPCVMPISSRVC